MKKYKSLEAWVREAMSDTDKSAACTAIACVYIKHSGGTKEIHTAKLEGKTHDPKVLAELFQGKAESYAQDLGGLQHFELQAFYGGSTEAQASQPFTVADGELQSGGLGRRARETPDASGLVAISLKTMTQTQEILVSLVQQQSVMGVQREAGWARREEQLQTEVTDGYSIIREMLMEKIKLDHDLRMKEMEYIRSTQERKKFFELLPSLANTVTGREIFPQSAADTALLDALSEKVKPEFISQLTSLGVIPAELAGPLTIRLSEAAEKRRKEEEAVKHLPPSNSDPGLDASGGMPSPDAE